MHIGKDKTQRSAPDMPAAKSSLLLPAHPRSTIPEKRELSRAHAGLSAHLLPPSPPVFFLFSFLLCLFLRHNNGVLEDSSHISNAHSSQAGTGHCRQSRGARAAPMHLGSVRMGLSHHKPAHGAPVRSLAGWKSVLVL